MVAGHEIVEVHRANHAGALLTCEALVPRSYRLEVIAVRDLALCPSEVLGAQCPSGSRA